VQKWPITFTRSTRWKKPGLLGARLANPNLPEPREVIARQTAEVERLAKELKEKTETRSKVLRALFSGGTLCYEAQVIWRELMNAPGYLQCAAG
jgi:uncharacterized small protein (DUF1192 family)